MKRNVILITYITTLLLLLASLCGCGQTPASNNDLDDYTGYLWNGGDQSKHLVKFAPELDEIPRDYLKYINLNPDEYEIETLNQWSNNNFGAQAAYHSFVYRKDEGPDEGFYIWVLDSGKVIDTRFVKELEPVLQSYFAEKIEKDYPGVRVIVSFDFHNMPSREWCEADGIETLLESDDDYRIYMYVVYGQDVKMTQSDVDTMKNEFLKLNDIEVCYYRIDNPDTVEQTELYSKDAEFRFYEYQ